MTSPTPMNTTKSWRESLADLTDLFRKWGVVDWIPPTFEVSRRQGYVTISFAVRSKWAHPRCAAYRSAEPGR